MGNIERFSVRLTAETVAVLNSFIESEEYGNLNDVIMEALNQFIMSRLAPEDMQRILERAGSRAPINPKALMAEDEYIGMDASIKAAVEKFVRGKMDEQR